jgi:hypothetical protein
MPLLASVMRVRSLHLVDDCIGQGGGDRPAEVAGDDLGQQRLTTV